MGCPSPRSRAEIWGIRVRGDGSRRRRGRKASDDRTHIVTLKKARCTITPPLAPPQRRPSSRPRLSPPSRSSASHRRATRGTASIRPILAPVSTPRTDGTWDARRSSPNLRVAAAATRLHETSTSRPRPVRGISTSRPRRRRDPSAEYLRRRTYSSSSGRAGTASGRSAGAAAVAASRDASLLVGYRTTSDARTTSRDTSRKT